MAQFVLGTAKNFGVLGGSTVTNTGPSIVSNGDVGASPGTAVTGFPPGIVAAGIIRSADAVAAQAQSDLTTAYNAMAGTACNTNLTGQDLGGLTLSPGVYCFDTSAAITGTLTLDVQNNPNAVFLFKVGSTLTTASASAVMAINGSACNKVFWQVATSATLGTGSTFAGDILALASVTLTTGANSSGRALARNGAVTLDSNNVNSCALIAAPTIDTVASPAIALGGSLTDSATVSGRVNPLVGATVTFRLYGPNDATCSGAALFAPAPVPYPVAGGPVTSPPFTPVLAGTYRWIASYSGDGNNAPVAGVCNAPNENVLVVGAGIPLLTTQASPAIVLGAGTVSDSGTVTGRTNPVAGGTITFALYGPNDANCTGAAVFTPPAVPYPVAGGPVNSASFTPTQAGIYRWTANYSGDANNPPAASICNSPNESVVVAPAQPLLSTTASPPIVLGAGSLTDSATVTGRLAPTAGATITFRLYGPNDATCATVPVFVSALVPYPIAGGPVVSGAFTPTLAGTYRWIASYSGDANNAPVVGVCNAPNESVVVAPAQPLLSTMASPDIVLGAGTLTDSATVTGRVAPTAGATITFRLYGPNDATCATNPVFVSAPVPYPIAGGPVVSGAFTPTLAGTYRWIASYSGDTNNAPIVGVCNAPNESVVVNAVALAQPLITTNASPGIVLGAGVLTDTATVTGRVNPLAGATVTFRLYGPNDATCAAAPVFVSAPVAYPVAGGPVTSPAFTPVLPGTYRWIASYSGDANNAPVTGPCNAPGESAEVLAAPVAAPVIPVPTLNAYTLLALLLALGIAGAVGVRRSR